VVLDPHRDGQFLYRRLEEAMLAEGTLRGGRTLDVACGVGKLAFGVGARGGEGWGLEPSAEMLGLSRWVHPNGRAALVRAIAETLPFRDDSFDRVICQGSLDHFVAPQDFMREAARVLRPRGRLVIALANYESLSCRLGRRLGRPKGRPYWEPPADHNHKGDLAFVRRLGNGALRLERCYGISLLWQFPRWGRCLNVLPGRPAGIVLAALDRLASQAPALADMIVSVWRPRSGSDDGQ